MVCPANNETVKCNECETYVHYMHKFAHDANHEEQRDQIALRKAHTKARRCSDQALIASMEANELRGHLEKKHSALEQQSY